MGIGFYETFCRLKEKYNTKNIPVFCTIQTNGILLDEKWAEFLAEEKILVGLSLDGPRSIHDVYRKDINGQGTFQRVMKSVGILERAGAEFNILTVLTEESAANIERIYNFFRSRNFLYQQYIPCLEPLGRQDMSGYSLKPKTYGEALKTMFDLWFRDIQQGIPVYHRFFENLVGMAAGYEPESCDMKGRCSEQYVIEADGTVYPCDFYVLDEYDMGNISEDSFEQIDKRRNQIKFIEPSVPLEKECRSCHWKHLCRGGCRRNRIIQQDGVLGKNRFCEAYQIFFPYAIERIKLLANQI